MYTIEFYEDSRGNSSVWQFLETLRIKALTNKDARIQYKQICLCLNLLEEKGTYLPKNQEYHHYWRLLNFWCVTIRCSDFLPYS